MLEHGRGGLPRDRRRDDDAEPADRGGGRDAEEPAGRVEERAAGKAVVHRRGRPESPGRSRGGGRSAAVRRSPTRCRRWRSRRCSTSGRPRARGARRAGSRRPARSASCRDPATRSTARLVVGSQPASSASSVRPSSRAHVQPVVAAERAHGRQHHVVSVHEAAGRPPAALDLHDGRRGGGDGVGELIGEGCEKVSGHAAIVAEARAG